MKEEKGFSKNAVRILFGGIITLLMIPAGCLIVLIRYVWGAMDKILVLIESKEKRKIANEGGLNDGEYDKNVRESN